MDSWLVSLRLRLWAILSVFTLSLATFAFHSLSFACRIWRSDRTFSLTLASPPHSIPSPLSPFHHLSHFTYLLIGALLHGVLLLVIPISFARLSISAMILALSILSSLWWFSYGVAARHGSIYMCIMGSLAFIYLPKPLLPPLLRCCLSVLLVQSFSPAMVDVTIGMDYYRGWLLGSIYYEGDFFLFPHAHCLH